MKTITHRRWLQNIKSGIFNFKFMTKPYLVNPINEDDLQWKTTSKYSKWNLCNHLLDSTKILNWRLDYQKSLKWRRHPIKDDLKISKVEPLSNQFMDHDLSVLRGTLEENSKEISSVALLSPACSVFCCAINMAWMV